MNLLLNLEIQDKLHQMIDPDPRKKGVWFFNQIIV